SIVDNVPRRKTSDEGEENHLKICLQYKIKFIQKANANNSPFGENLHFFFMKNEVIVRYINA
ncbi:hypothetical protein, partial [Enterococcus casseliflavus]|uniref:hypothetical protein n=1 Tax=Enterococcus casseliflavus TaxID=37734 RepID=UPI001BCC57B3